MLFTDLCSSITSTLSRLMCFKELSIACSNSEGDHAGDQSLFQPHFVTMVNSSFRWAIDRPMNDSERLYDDAVSMSVTPMSSTALSVFAASSADRPWRPTASAPKPRTETFRPVRPSTRVAIDMGRIVAMIPARCFMDYLNSMSRVRPMDFRQNPVHR